MAHDFDFWKLLAEILRSCFRILDKNPLSVFPIAYCTVSKMSPFIRAMDFAVEWNHAKEGQYIYQ